MRLGWYARLIIVLMAFSTLGNALYQWNQNILKGMDVQARIYLECVESQNKGLPFYGLRSGESCSDYSDRQLPWLFGWMSFSNELAQSAVKAIALGLLSIILYWACRWIWAGRPQGWPKGKDE